MSIVSSAISALATVVAAFTFLHTRFVPEFVEPEPEKKNLRRVPLPCEPCARVDQVLVVLLLASFLFGILLTSAVCVLVRRRAYVHCSEIPVRAGTRRREPSSPPVSAEVVVRSSVIEDLPRQTSRVKVLRPSSKHGR